MSLSGDLQDLSVVDLLQFIHLGGRSGTLVLQRDGERAQVTLLRGRIVGAHTPGTELGAGVVRQIEEAIIELVGWRNGRFHFEIDELGDASNLAAAAELNTQMLLLDAMRICAIAPGPRPAAARSTTTAGGASPGGAEPASRRLTATTA